MIRWGFQSGKQRFKCKSCGLLFNRQNKAVKRSNGRVWFYKWVIERQTLRYLAQDSGHSQSTLKRLFWDYLHRAPTFKIRRRQQAHLIVDGTYFSNDLCLVVYFDDDIKYTQLYRFSTKEDYQEMREDLENLKNLGIEIESITCDGHKSLLRAIRKVYPRIVVQRCVVHVHRQALAWLRKRPKTLASISLKPIVAQLAAIETHNDRLNWSQQIKEWHEQNKDFVNEQVVNPQTGRKWYRHKVLHQTVSLVLKAMPNLFHYLDNPSIPKSTNALESFFGHLKDSLSIHRGLSLAHRKQFIRWYLHLKNYRSKRFS